MSFETIIKNGLLVYPEKTEKGSIGISHGVITVLAPDTKESAGTIIDATGMYIFPGFIDPHVHPAYVDDIAAVSKTAAAGGVTSLLHYTSVKPGEKAVEVLSQLREAGEKGSYTDFALHASLFDTLKQCEEIPALAKMGVRSIKMFTAYQKLGWMTGDYALAKAMDLVAAENGIVSVHAENGCIIDFLEEKNAPVTADNFPTTSPSLLDKEAIFRVLCAAKTTGCLLYLPHISSQKGLEAMALGREEGIRFYSETCPHYLAFTWDELKDRGPLGRLRPPVKNTEDRDALWAALSDNFIDTIGSDHAPKDKKPKDDFAAAPYGAPGVQTILPVIWELGVNRGRLTASDMIRLCAENPAKIFGLAPKKGRLAEGADADIIVFDPTENWTIKHSNQLSNAPYTLYEGMKIQGKIVKVFQRGKLLVDEDEFTGETPDGRFLETHPG
ncbi:MAG: amidohydrolase family protein [Spirochaetales bacterium]|nr:amidohydrolase family protein [Spirochaetales bacterium]